MYYQLSKSEGERPDSLWVMRTLNLNLSLTIIKFNLDLDLAIFNLSLNFNLASLDFDFDFDFELAGIAILVCFPNISTSKRSKVVGGQLTMAIRNTRNTIGAMASRRYGFP